MSRDGPLIPEFRKIFSWLGEEEPTQNNVNTISPFTTKEFISELKNMESVPNYNDMMIVDTFLRTGECNTSDFERFMCASSMLMCINKDTIHNYFRLYWKCNESDKRHIAHYLKIDSPYSCCDKHFYDECPSIWIRNLGHYFGYLEYSDAPLRGNCYELIYHFRSEHYHHRRVLHLCMRTKNSTLALHFINSFSFSTWLDTPSNNTTLIDSLMITAINCDFYAGLKILLPYCRVFNRFKASTYALRNDKLECFIIIKEFGVDYSFDILKDALHCGIDGLRYVYELVPNYLDKTVARRAIALKSFDCLQFLLEKKCPVDSSITHFVVQINNIKMFKLLMKYKCPVDLSVIDYAIKLKRVKFLDLLMKNCQIPNNGKILAKIKKLQTKEKCHHTYFLRNRQIKK